MREELIEGAYYWFKYPDEKWIVVKAEDRAGWRLYECGDEYPFKLRESLAIGAVLGPMVVPPEHPSVRQSSLTPEEKDWRNYCGNEYCRSWKEGSTHCPRCGG